MSADTILQQIEMLLPKSVQEKLRSCPHRPRKGVHPWLNSTAASLHHYLGDQDCIAALLRRYSEDCGRPVEDDEIWNAILDSADWLGRERSKPKNRERRPKWPEPNKE